MQCIVWLGVELNSVDFSMQIVDRRIDKLEVSIRRLLADETRYRKVFVRSVAGVIGQIISMGNVIGSVCQLMTKSLSFDVANAANWNVRILLSSESLSQLHFWLCNIRKLNSKRLDYDPSCSAILFSDASGFGYGGYCVHVRDSEVQGYWSDDEFHRSSAWKEATAVFRVLKSLVSIVRDRRIKWFSDNQSVVSFLMKGSMKPDLQVIAMDVFSLSVQNNISLELEWIPRTSNEKADYLSKIVDYDDWSVGDEVFHALNRMWGPYSVDWFASQHNNKLEVFYSRYWCPSSAGVDAFTADWGGTIGWFVPPIILIPRVVRYAQRCRATGTLIIPLWKSSSFWPLVFQNDSFVRGILEYLDIPREREYYSSSRMTRSMFGNANLPFRMLALRFDFGDV